jgi:two-component system cell cycle sensor histidine kinase/response regulator CckA
VMRALVLDDELEVRRFVSRVLQAAGYVTEEFADGIDALYAIASGVRFELVVTDVRMPLMSGPEFVKELLRLEPDVKVLYLTGFNDQLFNERPTLWADEAFLDKPCSVKGLIEATSLLMFGSPVATPPFAALRPPILHATSTP